VRVDPQDRHVVGVAVGQRGEGRDADGALTPECGDAGGFVLLDDLQCAGELVDDDGFGLDSVDQVQSLVAHRDGCGRGRPVVGRQDGVEDRGADGVAAPRHVEGELGGELPHAGGACALPLRAQQPQGCTVATCAVVGAGLHARCSSATPSGIPIAARVPRIRRLWKGGVAKPGRERSTHRGRSRACLAWANPARPTPLLFDHGREQQWCWFRPRQPTVFKGTEPLTAKALRCPSVCQVSAVVPGSAGRMTLCRQPLVRQRVALTKWPEWRWELS
jgi:hypothetical protein